VMWNLSVVLIFIYFMARDREHFFHVFFSHLLQLFFTACSLLCLRL
jgi:hypothetical protein